MPIHCHEPQASPKDSEKVHNQGTEGNFRDQDAHKENQSYLKRENIQLVYASLGICSGIIK